ncbi:developmental regulator [Phlyctema vagabunda]|uniref:Developmental regulator n=1 Tax=Phlyctema vagabunda TaxID=108571 RepID=A0ABR4PVX1_9HELO
MPTYLVHGFRWHRPAIRIHIALYNLDDAAAEWIIAPATSITLLNSFYTLYDFLPPSAPPVSLNGNPRGARPLVVRDGNGGADRPGSNSNSASTLSGDANLEGREKDGDESKQKSDGNDSTQPHPVVKPRYKPATPHSKSYSNGSAASSETPTPTPKAQSPAPKGLLKSRAKSMTSLRGFGRKKTEQPPDLPELPAGGFGNAAVATPITTSTSSISRTQRPRSISTSVKRPSTASTDQSKPGRPEIKKKAAFNEWSAVKLIEQFDPTDLRSGSQPYAYVADYMVEVSLGVSISEEQARYEAKARDENQTTPCTPTMDAHMRRESSSGMGMGELSARELRRKNRRANWFEKLRDELQKNEDVGWYVVVCGDEERSVPSYGNGEGDLTDVDEDDGNDSPPKVKSPRSVGFRNFWTRRKNAPPPPPPARDEEDDDEY